MEAVEIFRFFGLLSFLTLAVGIGFIIRRWGKVSILSLSKHAARQQESRMIFAVSLTLSIVLFGLFGFGWLVPALQLGVGYGVLLGLALGCALVAGLVADAGGWQGRVHGVTAWTMAVCMPLLIGGLLIAPRVGVAAKFFLAIILSYLVFDWVLFTFARWSRKFFLIFQASYVLCFYLAMLLVAI